MDGNSTARLAESRRGHITRRERELGALASDQHGVVTRLQLLDAGLSARTIERRVERRQIRRLHRGVYSLDMGPLSPRGAWLAAVLACGRGAVLSHRSAAALWGLMPFRRREPVEVTCAIGRGRKGIVVHEGGIHPIEWTAVGGIPVTKSARTLFDLAEMLDEKQLGRVAEEADRLNLLSVSELEAVCARCPGRRALPRIRRLIGDLQIPEDTQSWLEDDLLDLCREHDLPAPVVGARVLGREVDALWAESKLMVEADSWRFHGHRAAFERDRKRDAAMQVEGFRVIRLTKRRIEREPREVADELRRLLGRGKADGRAGI